MERQTSVRGGAVQRRRQITQFHAGPRRTLPSRPRRPVAGGGDARAFDGRRVADLVLACVALVVTAPIALVAIIAIKLDDRGPVLYRQRRYGKHLRSFTVLKFRTMTHGAPSTLHESYIAKAVTNGHTSDESLLKLTDDPRVTRVGRILRRLSVDELPQLLNVLAGDMSIIGPRPAIGYELRFYEAHHYERFAVRPGMTGLWQVSGRSRLSFAEMLDQDVEYARRQSLRLDLLILAKTPAAILGGSA
jgi:lipopolysaccharide/colanic/teichoic acid biosynthesis glycosyltransferase